MDFVVENAKVQNIDIKGVKVYNMQTQILRAQLER